MNLCVILKSVLGCTGPGSCHSERGKGMVLCLNPCSWQWSCSPSLESYLRGGLYSGSSPAL